MAIGGPQTGFKKITDTLLVWGNHQSGQLGMGTYGATYGPPTKPFLPYDTVQKTSISITHSLYLGYDRNIYATGSNSSGQFGNGTTTSTSTFVQVASANRWIDVRAGDSISYAIRDDNTLWATGFNANGNLGLGDSTNRSSWTQVGSLTDWSSVFTCTRGDGASYGLKTDGSIWGWGLGYDNALPNGWNYNSPVLIDGTYVWNSISSQFRQLFAIKNDGTLWAMGRNWNYMLGDGTNNNASSLIQIGSATNWSYIRAGQDHTAGIRTDGTLWTWGYNNNGECGIGTNSNTISTPVQVGTDTNWSYVATGDSNGAGQTLAIRTDGTMWSWGGSSAPTGNLLTANSSPVQVGSLTTWKVVDTSYVSSLGIATYTQDIGDRYVSKDYLLDNYANLVPGLSAPGLFVSGQNNYGQLGLGDTTNRSSPVQLGSLTDWKTVDGWYHNLAIKKDNTLWAWGWDAYGQLGLGDTTNRSSPTQVGILTNWKSVNCGYCHTLAVKLDGTLWSWGRNDSEQIGDGTQIDRSSPIQIGSLVTWKQVSAGAFHSMAIKIDGTLWGWGQNGYGQVGDSTSTQKSSPVQIGNGTDWKIVSAGGYYSVALKKDGTLWAWGRNNFGQLGLGDITDRSSPVQVGTDADWKDISAGVHTLAIKNNGTLWSWGDNGGGGLGLGDTTNRSSPVQVGNLTNWKKISTSYYNVSAAVKTDGTLWAWGKNNSGGLMLGDITPRSSPTQVGSLTTWKEISCDGYSIIGVKDGYI